MNDDLMTEVACRLDKLRRKLDWLQQLQAMDVYGCAEYEALGHMVPTEQWDRHCQEAIGLAKSMVREANAAVIEAVAKVSGG